MHLPIGADAVATHMGVDFVGMVLLQFGNNGVVGIVFRARHVRVFMKPIAQRGII